jgi:hypothetical protein
MLVLCFFNCVVQITQFPAQQRSTLFRNHRSIQMSVSVLLIAIATGIKPNFTVRLRSGVIEKGHHTKLNANVCITRHACCEQVFSFDLPPLAEQIGKPVHIQALIPEPAVKAFHVPF